MALKQKSNYSVGGKKERLKEPSSVVYEDSTDIEEGFLLDLTVRRNTRGRKGRLFHVIFSLETARGGGVSFRRHFASVNTFFAFLSDSVPLLPAQADIDHEEDSCLYRLIQKLRSRFHEEEKHNPRVRPLPRKGPPAKVLRFPSPS